MIWILASFQLGHDVYLWPPNRASLFILQLWFLLLFPHLFSVVADWMSARGFLKVQDTKIRHLHTIAKLCWAISSQLRRTLTIGKNSLNSCISSTCPHNMVNCGPLTADIGWWVWGTPANFNGFRVLASLLQRRRSTEVNQTLYDVWPCHGLVHYIPGGP